MSSETFNLSAKNPYTIPVNKRFVYGTEMVTINCLEANSDGEIPKGTMELTYALRSLNTVFAFSLDTGFRILMGLEKKTGNAWEPVDESDGKQVFLRCDFGQYLFDNCRLRAYDRDVLRPCEGYQVSNSIVFGALKSFLDEKFVENQYLKENDLSRFNHYDKTLYNLTGGQGKDLYQQQFAKFYENTQAYQDKKQNFFYFTPRCFPFWQASWDGNQSIGIFSIENRDSLDRRLHLKLVLPPLDNKTIFAYVKDNTTTQYRLNISRIELQVKRGLLLDSFIKTIPRQLKYNLLRWRCFHRGIQGPLSSFDMDFYQVYMPVSIVICCTAKYNLSVDDTIQFDDHAKSSDSLLDINLTDIKFYFDSVLIAHGDNGGVLNYRKDTVQRLHIFRSFFNNGITTDPKVKMSVKDYFSTGTNRHLLYYVPLQSYGEKEGGAPFTLPKESFSPSRFAKKADAKLSLNIASGRFSDKWEILCYFFYHLEAPLTVSKVQFEDLPV